MSDVVSFPDLGSDLTRKIIECAINVHRHFGPGLLESVYEECLGIELKEKALNFKKQYSMPVEFHGHKIENAYRLDFWVEDKVVIEIKSVEQTLPIHEAQILTYMRMSKSPLGLLINFNYKLLKDGIKRYALSEFSA